MGVTTRVRVARSASMSVEFSRARSQPTCRRCCRPSSTSSSISKLRKRWASRCQAHSSHRQPRSLNDVAYWALFGHAVPASGCPLFGVMQTSPDGPILPVLDPTDFAQLPVLWELWSNANACRRQERGGGEGLERVQYKQLSGVSDMHPDVRPWDIHWQIVGARAMVQQDETAKSRIKAVIDAWADAV